MNQIAIPANTDQITYYAVFSESKNNQYIQCSSNYKDLHAATEFWRYLNEQYPDKTPKIYQVLISQIYVPKES
jgi:hypothetical protein